MATELRTPDRELLLRLRSRDREAWTVLYTEYQPRLRGFAYRLSGNPHDADDLVQETFVRAVPRLDSLDPDTADVQAYLFTTLRNLFLKQVERTKRAQPMAEVPEPIAPSPIEGDPERSTMLARQVHEVRVANGRLDSRQRLVLALRELEERSYAEIGEIVGLKENAVAQLIFRARESLRIELRLAQVDPDSMPEECRAFLPLLARHLDGELKGKRGEKAMAHLEGCERCQSALADMEEASRRYRTLFPPLLATGYDDARAATDRELEDTGYWETTPGRRAGSRQRGARRLGRRARVAVLAVGLLALGGGGAALAVALDGTGKRTAAPASTTAPAPRAVKRAAAAPTTAATTKPKPVSKPKPKPVAKPASTTTTTAAEPTATEVVPPTTTAKPAPPTTEKAAPPPAAKPPPAPPKKPPGTPTTTTVKPPAVKPDPNVTTTPPKTTPPKPKPPKPKPPVAVPPKDTTAPTVQLTSAPAAATSTADASIAFTAGEPGVAFTCRIDGGAPAPCTSPVALAGLTPGAHAFAVRATDAAGNTGAETSVQWTYTPPDTTAPSANITSRPPASTYETTATFAFTADEAGVSFACALDGAAPSACASPAVYSGLAVGLHQFSVSATDAAGNTSAPITASWTVAAPLPDLRVASLTKYSIVVTNAGAAAATVPSILTITLIGTFTVPALAPGASATFNWSICRVGTYSAIVDRTGVVAESDETNNTANLANTCP